MRYRELFERLTQEDPDPGRSGLIGYLLDLAARALVELDERVDATAQRRFAAVSGLVRACPPGASILLDGASRADLVAASIDIEPGRHILRTPRLRGDRHGVNTIDSRAQLVIHDLAQRLGVAADTSHRPIEREAHKVTAIITSDGGLLDEVPERWTSLRWVLAVEGPLRAIERPSTEVAPL